MNLLEFREDFPIVNHMAYLDIAYGNPVPESVKKAMSDYLSRVQRNGVSVERIDSYQCLAQLKAGFADLINADSDEIAIIKNTSDGLNIAANGIFFQPGDNIVLNQLEHLNNTYCWIRLREKGVDIRVAPMENGRVSVESIASVIDENTKVVAISSITNLGFRFDLEKISKLCQETGSYLVIDAVQSLGIEPMDVQKIGVDIFSSSAHKGLLGPHGIGYFFCRKEVIDEIKPVYVAGISYESSMDPFKSRLKSNAGKFEYGNYNYIALHGAVRGIEILKAVGIEKIHRHSWGLAEAFRDRLDQVDITCLDSERLEERSHIVTFKVPGVENIEVKRLLDLNKIRLSSHYRDVRASFAGYNNIGEIDNTVQVLRKIM